MLRLKQTSSCNVLLESRVEGERETQREERKRSKDLRELNTHNLNERDLSVVKSGTSVSLYLDLGTVGPSPRASFIKRKGVTDI